MALSDSALDGNALARATALLATPTRRDPAWPALLAATVLALSSVAFAMAMVLAPPATKTEAGEAADPDPGSGVEQFGEAPDDAIGPDRAS